MISGEDAQVNVPQGKLHSPIVEKNGYLYFATHLANYWNEAQDAYTGSHLIRYELGSYENGEVQFLDYGIHRNRFSTYSALAIDPAGTHVWWVATPFATDDVTNDSTHLYRTNLVTQNTVDYGALDPSYHGPQASSGLHVDARGDAWITMLGGSDKLYVARAGSQTITAFDGALPQMTSYTNPSFLSPYQSDTWWYWGQSIDSEKFVFTMRDSNAPKSQSAGGSLWIFDAEKTIGKNPGDDISDAFKQVAWIGATNLAMYYDNGEVYFVRRSDGEHAPKIDAFDPMTGIWDPNDAVRLHLYSVNIYDPSGTVKDWGVVTEPGGSVPWRTTSVSADATTGEVYLVADWADVPVAWRSLRHDTGPTTTYTQLYRGQVLSIASTQSILDQTFVSIVSSDPNAGEPNNGGEFTISRAGDNSEALTVNYSVAGTATPGSDYAALTMSVVIPAHADSVTLPVTILDDPDAEVDETVVVSLTADLAYQLTQASTATVYISSDETLPLIEITTSDGNAGEPDNDGQITITRAGGSAGTTEPLIVYFNVNGTATGGTDYASIGTSAVIPIGQSSVDVSISVHDDGVFEGSESVDVTLVGDAAYTLGSSVATTVVILDDDAPPIPTAGLIGYWSLDETSGSTVSDGSGHGYDGTVSGAAWGTGTVNGGLDFDGNDDSVDVGLGPAIIGTGGFSVSTWVKTTSATSQVLVQQRSPQGYNGEYILQALPTGHVYFWTFGGFLLGPTVTSTQPINDGQWHHVLGVREDDGTMKLYIDGALDVTATGPARPLIALNVYLGADKRDNVRYLNGSLDEVRIYDRALDAQEASLLALQSGGTLDAADDSYNASEDSVLIVPAPGLLNNDQGAGLTVSNIDSTSQAGLPVSGGIDGSFNYDPNGQFESLSVGQSVSDTFTYSITDGSTGDTATVTISVQGQNDAPTAADDFASLSEDASADIVVVANDNDPDQADTLIISSVDDTGVIGDVTFAGGSITYDPNGQFESLAEGVTDSETFTYTVSDGNGGTDTATIQVTVNGVNDAPVATPEDASTDENTPINISVLSGDSDVDSPGFNLTAVDTTGTVGLATLNGNQVSYDPNGQFDSLVDGQTAVDTFSYIIADDLGATAIALVTVTINGLGAGTAAFDDTVTTDEDNDVVINVLANDTVADPPAALMVASVDNAATIGVATKNPNDTISYDPNGMFHHLSVGETEIDTFTYTVDDGTGGIDTATVTVTVTGVNDAPDAVDDAYGVDADNVLTVPPPGVLSNDSDVDAQSAGPISGFFAAPDGTAGGDGSIDAPWDLTTLFSHPAVLQPGDTVYLRGGTYFGAPDSTISGTASQPIKIRPYPGEHVIVDTYAPATFGEDRIIGLFGDYVHWQDLEFMSSDPSSRITNIPGPGYPDINRGNISVQGSHNEFRGIVVHDLDSGFGFWSEGTGGLIDEALVFNNGWLGPDRPHGHGIYLQNEFGVKQVRNSIIFNQFGMGIHAFGTESASIKGLDLEGNIVFNNGGGAGQGYVPERDILIGGGTPAENIRVANNYTYQQDKNGVVQFGFLTSPDSLDAVITDNYFVDEVNFRSGWNDVTYTGNTNVVSALNRLTDIVLPSGVSPATYTWDDNDYFAGLASPFVYEGQLFDFPNWQTTTGWDATTSSFATGAPATNEVFVRPSQIDSDRANVVVYNWALDTSVDVDLSAVLEIGDSYEIRHAVEVNRAPIASGTFNGGLISVPMAAAIPPSPLNYDAQPPVGIGPEFGVFIVTNPNAVVGPPLTVTSFDATSILGASVSLDSEGGFVYDSTGLAVVQGLGPNDQLQDTFTYTITDADGATDTATVAVTISGVNDPPTAMDDNASTDEDSDVSIDVLLNDDSGDVGDSIRVQSIDSSGTQGSVTLEQDDTFTYDPSPALNSLGVGESLVETFTYTIVDGSAETDTATVTVTVTGVNDAPDAIDDAASTDKETAIAIDVLANDSDPDMAATSMVVQRVADGLSNPVFVTSAPGEPDLLFIAEQEGAIRILDLQTGLVNPTPFLTITDLSYNVGGVRGLLGMAFHPDYANNSLFYVYITDVNQDSLIRQYQANPGGLTADPTSATTILGIPQIDKYHYGGWIGFGPNDDLLYIASGDGGPGNDTDNDAQTITGTLRGKILRIDVDGDDFPADANKNYAIPPTNPFVGTVGDDEIWVYGLRNPWRSSFDRATGDLYIGDVGQNAREEITFQPAGSSGGENYGWRAREGTISNPGMPDPDPLGAIDPIYDYLQGTAALEGYSVTGGYVYRGPIQDLQGKYFFGDFVSEQVWSFEFNGDSRTNSTAPTLRI